MTGGKRAGSIGHAYIALGDKRNLGRNEDVFGFYPVKGGLGIIKGPGMQRAEYRCADDDDCSPSRQRELRTRLSMPSASAMIAITSEERQAVIQEMYKWNGRNSVGTTISTPLEEHEYRLLDRNCIDFVSAVATRLGYPTPPRSDVQTPTDFIKALRVTVEQEEKRREVEQRARDAEARATAAEEAARAAAKRASEAEAKARDAEERA